jgi:hypothetical protein
LKDEHGNVVKHKARLVADRISRFTLIEEEDDTRSWGNFLVLILTQTHTNAMPTTEVGDIYL